MEEIMKKNIKKHPQLISIRKKLWSAAALLLVGAVMFATTSYAWLTLSVAPEVTGITTNVGANGSLEIALLNTETHNDISLIKTRVGVSTDNQGPVAANTTWGNLVDVSDPYYGLNNIKLMPSQFLIESSSTAESGYTVNPTAPITLPKYGTDGRIIELDGNPVSAVYNSGRFAITGTQTYGLRGLGTTSAGTAVTSLINLSKSYISSFSSSAKSTAINSINSNGNGIINIMLRHRTSPNESFNDNHVNQLKTVISDLTKSFDHIGSALRYAMIGNLAQSGVENLNAKVAEIRNQDNDIEILYETYEEYMPEAMSTWIAKYTQSRNSLYEAFSACNTLEGGEYSWNQIEEILRALIDTSGVYIDDAPYSNVNADSLLSSDGFTMTLISGSGSFADIADFTGDYGTWLEVVGMNVEFKARTTNNPAYLIAANNTISAIDGDDASIDNLEVENLGGYAIDLAFRCNAEDSDLQLQISPEQRIYADSPSSDLQGGGSYMQFTATDKTMPIGKLIELMDAIRVTFVDARGDILAIAKLNTSNRTIEANNSIKAYLYLYNYTVATEDGINVVKMGERRTGDIKITELARNEAKAVTAIVWLDGTLVDNTMVSAIARSTLEGVMNLQFSSSADLIPAENYDLYSRVASRTDLNGLLEDEVENYPVTQTYENGQRDLENDSWYYTNESWRLFSASYEYAAAIFNSSQSSNKQIKDAYNELCQAYDSLATVSFETLEALIAEARELAGTTEEIAGCAMYGLLLTEYTDEQYDELPTIYKVNAQNNIHIEGDGIQTPIYTENSWRKLARAIYDAEAVIAFGLPASDDYDGPLSATEEQIDAAISALETAMTMLERGVYYAPYDLNGTIYYFALTDETDTYGKWYDSEFNRVVSDLKILDLDSMAKPAKFAEISANRYYEISSNNGVAARVDLNTEAYPSLENDTPIGIRWSFTYPYQITDDINNDQIITITELRSKATALISNEYYNQIPEADKTALENNINKADDITGENIILKPDKMSEFIDSFTSAINVVIADIVEKIDTEYESRTQISADDRTVLTAAILEAETVIEKIDERIQEITDAVNGGDLSNEDVAELNNERSELETNKAELNEVLSEARTLIETETVDKSVYDEKLGALNDQITVCGGTAQTAYNVLKYSVDYSNDYSGGINRAYPSAALSPEVYAALYNSLGYVAGYNMSGVGTLNARIVTEKGVIYTPDPAEIKFYNRAERIEIDTENVSVNNATGERTYGIKIIDKENVTVTALVIDPETGELSYTTDTVERVECNETPKKYYWSVSDTGVYSISGATTSQCTVKRVSDEGTATLTLTVTMDTGNQYTAYSVELP